MDNDQNTNDQDVPLNTDEHQGRNIHPVDVEDVDLEFGDGTEHPLQRRTTKVDIGEDEEIPHCRICLVNEMQNPDDPLINPCYCKGSIGLIHIKCLQQWMNSVKKVKYPNDYTIEYSWRLIVCDLCKKQLPSIISFKNKRVNILDFEEPTDNGAFVILESYPKEGTIKSYTNKSIYVVDMTGRSEVKMGRGHEADIRIADISVSRLHAVLKFDPAGNISLHDRSSKFGTLVLLKHPLFIPADRPHLVTVQAGRTLVTFSNPGTRRTGGGWCFKRR